MTLYANVAWSANPSGTDRLPAEDVQRLADIMTVESPKVAVVSQPEALATLALHYRTAFLGARVDPYLETVTLTGTLGTNRPITDQPVWIVRLAGFTIEGEGLAGAQHESDTPASLHTAYVFVDATTGEFIMTVWQP